MRYYPVFLDLAGKPVVVIGGGRIAHQKIENLLKAGAVVTVISPELNEDMKALKDARKFRHIERKYEKGDLEGAFLVFAAANDRQVNAAVSTEGKERGVWVNAVDDPPYCDFIMPGIVQRGDLIVAVSTSGTSPAMARKMREELDAFLTEEYARMLELAAEVRLELREQGIMADPETWNAALDGELKRMLLEGRREEAKARLVGALTRQGAASEGAASGAPTDGHR